ncbi:MAG: CBS domain-containing protein [Bacteriovoracaceae bacterium]|nr:CBS domain-containing protein [Bacteriovoracaceae bacterium]
MRSSKDFENLTVEEYTTPAPIIVKASASITTVMKEMQQREIRHLPVVDDNGAALGLISERDLASVKSFYFRADLTAKDIMTADPISVNYHVSLIEAAFIMAENKIGSLIVNDDNGDIYGIFTSTDAINALIEVLRGDAGEEAPQIQDY